jgi:surface protein
MNYFTLIEDIKRTSLQFAEEFYEGDVYEFLNSGNHKYPSIILTTQNVSTTDNINSISGTLFCVDRLTDDSSNRLEIQSNAFNKLQRIISALEENTINLQSNTYTPFTEKFADLCGGMFVEFSFQYVGESLCDDLEIKEIELTQNGIYDVIGYDRAIVNVKPVVNLEDITITDNGEYTCGEGFDGFGKVNVDLKGKVKLPSLPQISNNCINSEGRWEADVFIDTSLMTKFSSTFMNNSKLKYLDVSGWDTSNITELGQLFRSCSSLKTIKGIGNWNTSKVTNMAQVFAVCSSLSELDIENWNVTSVTSMWYMFQNLNLTSLDLSKWSVPNLANVSEMFKFNPKLKSLIGNRTIEEVLENNIGCLNGLKVSLKLSDTALDRASLRAIINGLAEVETTQTLTLGATLRAKLTEEDIAIMTNKGWSIA